MSKEGKARPAIIIPETAFPVREIGGWTIYVSKKDEAVYITSASAFSPLRITKAELLELLKGVHAGQSGAKASPAGPDQGETTQETSRNRRQTRRFTRRCEAEFTAGNITNRGIASDFSLTGLFLRTGNPFPPDTIIDILVFLPDGATSLLKARVKRSMKTPLGKVIGVPVKELKNGMGVEIIKRDPPYLNYIRSLL